VVPDALLCLLHLSILFVNTLMGCKGLFFLVMLVIIDTAVRLFTVRYNWVYYQFSSIISVYSVF